MKQTNDKKRHYILQMKLPAGVGPLTGTGRYVVISSGSAATSRLVVEPYSGKTQATKQYKKSVATVSTYQCIASGICPLVCGLALVRRDCVSLLLRSHMGMRKGRAA